MATVFHNVATGGFSLRERKTYEYEGDFELDSTAEVTSRLKKDWLADEKAYDEGHLHMLMFSDALTDGIRKQHSEKFGK